MKSISIIALAFVVTKANVRVTVPSGHLKADGTTEVNGTKNKRTDPAERRNWRERRKEHPVRSLHEAVSGDLSGV